MSTTVLVVGLNAPSAAVLPLGTCPRAASGSAGGAGCA